MKISSKLLKTSFAVTGSEQPVCLKDFSGKNIVLYFYPKDDTSGCTQEGKDFSQHYKAFQKLNTVILGVSRESIASHEKFKAKYDFPFELISDPEEVLCQAFDVIKEKSMYGRKYLGIERSTFLIDDQGKIQQEWRKVKVTGHVAEVLKATQAL